MVLEKLVLEKSTARFFAEHKSEAGHSQRSLRGGAVAISARVINALIQIGSVLFLARLLSPEDYGLVAMVAAITGFAPLVVCLGTRDAVAQWPRITEKDVSAVFWITMAVGCALAAIGVGCAPLIARLYHEPRLVPITIALSLTFVVSALACQHSALLRRSMEFRKLSIIEITANLLSAGGAIGLALFGFHYWALVLRPFAMQSFTALGVWLECRWVPSRPALTPASKEMLKFGLNSTGFTATDFTSRSCDRVLIGYRSGARSLGFYQNAMFVYDSLTDILVLSTFGVAVPAFSKVRDDPPELRRLWRKALSTMAFFAMPAFGVLAVTATDLIPFLLGKKWASAGVLLSILAIRGIPQSVERTLGWLHVTAGRTDRWMRWGIFGMCAHLIALFIGLPFGPRGVVIAYVILMFLLFVPAVSYAGKPLGIGAGDVIKAVWRQMAGSLIAVAAGFLLRWTIFAGASVIAMSAGLGTAYLAIYCAVVVGVFRLQMPLGVVLLLVRDFLPPRLARAGGYETVSVMAGALCSHD
jgi:PST family polysaccharide transporter